MKINNLSRWASVFQTQIPLTNIYRHQGFVSMLKKVSDRSWMSLLSRVTNSSLNLWKCLISISWLSKKLNNVHNSSPILLDPSFLSIQSALALRAIYTASGVINAGNYSANSLLNLQPPPAPNLVLSEDCSAWAEFRSAARPPPLSYTSGSSSLKIMTSDADWCSFRGRQLPLPLAHFFLNGVLGGAKKHRQLCKKSWLVSQCPLIRALIPPLTWWVVKELLPKTIGGSLARRKTLCGVQVGWCICYEYTWLGNIPLVKYESFCDVPLCREKCFSCQLSDFLKNFRKFNPPLQGMFFYVQ